MDRQGGLLVASVGHLELNTLTRPLNTNLSVTRSALLPDTTPLTRVPFALGAFVISLVSAPSLWVLFLLSGVCVSCFYRYCGYCFVTSCFSYLSFGI